jgi:hypothetical protein
MRNIVLSGLLSMVLFSMSHFAFAECADINAGPIWNNEDAKSKCAVVCDKHHLTWDGNWRTVEWNKMSVCGCCTFRTEESENFVE